MSTLNGLLPWSVSRHPGGGPIMMTSGSGVVDASLAIAAACGANIASVGAAPNPIASESTLTLLEGLKERKFSFSRTFSFPLYAMVTT